MMNRDAGQITIPQTVAQYFLSSKGLRTTLFRSKGLYPGSMVLIVSQGRHLILGLRLCCDYAEARPHGRSDGMRATPAACALFRTSAGS